jgi:hypothetical protein
MLDRQTLKSALAATPDCLSIEELGDLSVDEARKHKHVSACAHCQTELTMLREFESSTPLADEGAAVAWISSHLERRLDEIKNPSRAVQRQLAEAAAPRTSSWLARLFAFPNMRVLAPIAAVVAIAVGGFLFLQSPKEPELQANLGHEPAIYRSQELQTVSPSGELLEAPKNLQWKPVPGATMYKFSITEVDHTEVWNGQTVDTLMTIPPSVLAKMRVGKPFLWKVSALDPQGAVLASSQAQRFVVAPAHRD